MTDPVIENSLSDSVFDAKAMQRRKQAYYAFVRQHAAAMFEPDGRYAPGTRADLRLPYWVYPALISSPDPAMRAFANAIYAAGAAWNAFDVFCISSVAVNLVRHRDSMGGELAHCSEEYLARFTISEGGRAPCSGANDYIFHGYNDNMPAMSVRALILAGEALGRDDFLDRGLFNLEGLCAHFQRRGLLSEYTSPTYTPITLTALMDVAECAVTQEARDMALACANRIAIDLIGHWHRGVGAIVGAMSRSYTPDATATFSNANTLLWYWSGDPLCFDPIHTLTDDDYDGPMAHERNRAWNICSMTEMFSPDYQSLSPEVAAFASRPQTYPYELHATSDSGQQGLLGAVKEVQTRAFFQPHYGLGTASETWFGQSGQQLTLHGGLTATPTPANGRDRVTFWHHTREGAVAQGDFVAPASGAAHAVSSAHEVGNQRPPTEVSGIHDVAMYHTLQKGGSAMVLGMLGTGVLGQEIEQLTMCVVFHIRWRKPEEQMHEDRWHFLRFGDVYVGVRPAAMVAGRRIAPRYVAGELYVAMEMPLLHDRGTVITREFREWCDFGYVFEIASKEECSSFEVFRDQCKRCTWEFNHAFYRNSRYGGRHGELHIVDSVAAGTARFMVIDGQVEPRTRLSASGLDTKLTELFPDGRRIQLRRLTYDPDYIGSPFYEWPAHIIEADVTPHRDAEHKR